MKNLMEGLLSEISRAKDILQEYERIPNGAGKIGAAMIIIQIKKAEKSIIENDVIKMLSCYESLKNIE
jgi:hypothetical protein